MQRKTFMTSPRRNPEIRNNIKAQMVQAEVLASIKRRKRLDARHGVKSKFQFLTTKKGKTVHVCI